MLLCDFAEELNGKLYIMGGGWSRLAADKPINIALAVKLAIPWDQANRRHKITFSLVTEDGEVHRDAEGKPVELHGHVEVGRPPGLRAGTPLDAPLAVKIDNLTLPAGGYRWDLLAGGTPIAQVPFQAVKGGV